MMASVVILAAALSSGNAEFDNTARSGARAPWRNGAWFPERIISRPCPPAGAGRAGPYRGSPKRSPCPGKKAPHRTITRRESEPVPPGAFFGRD